MTVSGLSLTRLIMTAGISMMLLGGCQDYLQKCPQLRNPPASVVKALTDVRKDPEGRQWVIDFSKHLDKLKVCQ